MTTSKVAWSQGSPTFSNAEARTAFENEEPGIVQVADGKWAEMESERAQKKGCFSCF